MKAVMFQGLGQLSIEDVPLPRLQSPLDVIVRVTTATICGSDIHIKHGEIPGIPSGTVIGHEFAGVVEETGTHVTRFRPGDRVAASAMTWCGFCPACKRGDIQYCKNGGIWAGGTFFGPGLSGAQTEYIRVAYADNCLTPIPDNVADAQAVFVGDVFGTGYHGAYAAHIQTGDVVIVYGCGPIGLGAIVSAWQFGPREVFAVDTLENRLALARHYGATPIDAKQGDAVELLRAATHGECADVAIEAIGAPSTFLQALGSVRRGGTVSVVGLFPQPAHFPLAQLGLHGIKVSMGLANLSRMAPLMALLESGRVDLTPLATHEFPLESAMEAYDLFECHKDQCVKVLLKP